MLPDDPAFMAAHQLADVTVVADAGMVSEANKQAIEAAGLSFILGARIPDIPYVVQPVARASTPTATSPTGTIFTQPWPAGPSRPAPGPGHLLPVPGRPGPAHPARHRRAGRQGRDAPSPGRRRSSATGSSASPAPTSP